MHHANSGHSVVVAGIGPDSHSVGLTVLREALRARGYDVVYLGIQNSLSRIFSVLPANAVLISSMDGQAEATLMADVPAAPGRDAVVPFPVMLQRNPEARQARWYIGGNLTIDSGHGAVERFSAMGFQRVHPKYVDITTVLDELEADLAEVAPIPARRSDPGVVILDGGYDGAARIPHDDFLRRRAQVLTRWHTLRMAADAADNARFLTARPSLAAAQMAARASGRTLVQPRIGVADVREMLHRFDTVTRLKLADVVSHQVDGNTRADRIEEADRLYREEPTALNGTPLLSFGVPALRDIGRQIRLPLQVRHSARYPEPLAEMAFAGGATAFEGGPICYNVPYYKDLALTESLHHWRYVDRLCGLYAERYGVIIDREYFGTLTATLIPPALAIAIDIIEAMVAGEQGVRCVTLGYAEQGHREQDVAAIRVAQRLGERMLHHRFPSMQVSTVFCQYMAAFPSGYERAAQLISASATTAHLARATRILTKTPVEALHIPSLEENVDGLSIVNRAMATGPHRLTPTQEARVRQEEEVIEAEVLAIVESVLHAGNGDLSRGVVAAFRSGALDIPFAPSDFNQGRLTPIRDADGAVRVLAPGGTAFGAGDIGAFHRERVSERLRQDGLTERTAWQCVTQDIMGLPNGTITRWPWNSSENLGRLQGPLDVEGLRPDHDESEVVGTAS